MVSGQKNSALNDRRKNLRTDLWGYNLSMMEESVILPVESQKDIDSA